MNPESILICGKTLVEVRQQQTAIRQAATKIISDAITEGERLVRSVEEKENLEEILADLEAALKLFELATEVSNATGVVYYMDSYLSSVVDALHGAEWYDPYTKPHTAIVSALVAHLQEMEYASEGWNSSNC